MKKDTLKKLISYSSVATLATVITDASATVHSTDVNPDVTITPGDDYMLDIDGNGVDDFRLTLITNTTGFIWAGGFGQTSINAFAASTDTFYGSTQGYAYTFASGVNISAGPSFIVNTSTILFSSFGGKSYGNWINGVDDKYVGVRFKIDGAIHYGWIYMSTAPNNLSYTIQAYGYQDITAAPAMTGLYTSVNNKVDDDVVIYSFNNSIRVNTNQPSGSVEVFNLQGQLILREEITSKQTTIAVETGLVVVVVESEGNRTSQKLSIE